MGILAIATAAFTVQSLLRVRAEEIGGRAEPLLATAVSRPNWMLSHVVRGMDGTVVLLLLGGLAAGVGFAGATDETCSAVSAARSTRPDGTT